MLTWTDKHRRTCLGRDGIFATPPEKENQGRVKSKVCQLRPNPKFHSMKVLSRYITSRTHAHAHTPAERDKALHKRRTAASGSALRGTVLALVFHPVSAVFSSTINNLG